MSTAVKPAPELWREIPGYEGLYSVSDVGRVRTERSSARGKAGQILKPTLNANGYFAVRLSKGGRKKTGKIYKLVALAFLGECPPSLVVNHKDGVKTNDRCENLEYVTYSRNIKHAYELGLTLPVSGEKCGAAKVTEAQVYKIRELSQTHSQREIAKIFAISKGAVQHIVRRRTWNHLPEGKTA